MTNLVAKPNILFRSPSGDRIEASTSVKDFTIKSKKEADISLVTVGGNVVRTWKFDTSGNITLPADGDIIAHTGDSIISQNTGNIIFTGNLNGNVTGNLTGNVNKVTLTSPTNAATITISNNKTLTVSNTLSFSGTDSSTIQFGSGGTVAYTANNLSVFAATTSTQLRGIISDETGTGSLVFSESPTFTGTPLAPTATSGTNTTQIATTQFVKTAIDNLIASAPGALDTLDELAAALGDDSNFASTITTALSAKAPLANPTFTGTVGGITSSMVGLGNVTNESKSTMFSSPAFTGTASTAALSVTNDTVTTTYTDGALVVTGGVGIGGSLRSNSSLYDSKGEVRNLPQNAQTSAYTLIASDAGKHIAITTGGVTVPQNTFSIGDTVVVYNNSGSNQTITQGSGTSLLLSGTSSTGNRTLQQRGLATLLCVAANTFVIAGGGVI